MDGRPPTDTRLVTERQREVARLVAEGYTNERIAEELGISLAGAKYHVSELLGRLGVRSREQVGEWYRGDAGRSRAQPRVIVSWLGWLAVGGVAAAALAAIVLLIVTLNEGDGVTAPSAQSAAMSTAIPTEQPPVPSGRPGTFAAVVGGPASERGHTVTVLDDGRVLIAGGSQYIQPRTEALSSTEFFEPSTGDFIAGPPLSVPRWGHTATLLEDGRVLLAGGGGDSPLASAEIFDPSTGASWPTDDLIEARTGHGAVRLADGRVLIVGGFRESRNPDFSLEPVVSAEIYDPDTGQFEPAGESPALLTSPVLVLLDDGRVLIVGDGPLVIFEPGSGSFRSLDLRPPGIRPTATLLEDGRVLIVGGSDREAMIPAPGPSSHGSGPATSRAVIFNPLTEDFTDTGEMAYQRQDHAAVRLADGRVLITGGARDVHHDLPLLESAEIYDPATGAFSVTGSMLQYRFGHLLALLSDGSVLVTGVVAVDSLRAERYTP